MSKPQLGRAARIAAATIWDLRAMGRRRTPRAMFDVDGAAEAERTMEDVSSIARRPHYAPCRGSSRRTVASARCIWTVASRREPTWSQPSPLEPANDSKVVLISMG